MSRTKPRPEPATRITLQTCHDRCWVCGCPMWVAYHNHRTVHTLEGLLRLTLPVRRCRNPECERYHKPYRPEEEGHYALPHGEFGLDVIALVGALRFSQHKSVPQIHEELSGRGVQIAERSVTEQLRRYEELVALRLADRDRLKELFAEQGHVILALDGLQPDVGHEVLWVLRDCVSGEILLARSLLGGSQADLAPLLEEVRDTLPVPIRGVVSDGQHSIRNAVASAVVPVPLFEGSRQARVRSGQARQEGAQEAGAGSATNRESAGSTRRFRGGGCSWLLSGCKKRAHR